jgi:hypothetical protein
MNSRLSAADLRAIGQGVRFAFRGCMYLYEQVQKGHISKETAGVILIVPIGGVCYVCCEYGVSTVVSAVLAPPEEDAGGGELSEEERQVHLDALEEARNDLQRVGSVAVLAGTAPPATWTSEQKTSSHPKEEFECVPLTQGQARTALAMCLEGHDVGAGGRDASTSRPYDELELVDAWRIENATLWGKFAAERMQTQATFQRLDKHQRARVATPHIRKGLAKATAPLRNAGGCDASINETYLIHGLGDPSCALNIIGAGFNEHFSGVNAGTLFGDGIYLAEDVGKSDQYCRPREKRLVSTPFTKQRQLEKKLWAGRAPPPLDEVRYIFVCRAVLGCFIQVGASTTTQLRSKEPVFAAVKGGGRELALIPNLETPTHYHSEVAEIAAAANVASDTHTERGGNHLRFREFVVFRPTLLYPEYLVAYRRKKRQARSVAP